MIQRSARCVPAGACKSAEILPAALIAALVAAALATPASAYQRYRYPLNGPHNYGNLDVTGFGVKRADGSIHTGQDIIANCGTPIVAAHDGVVKSAGYSAGYGNYVVIGGLGTRFDFVYGHMKGRSRVGAGKPVRAGQRHRLGRPDRDGQRRLPPPLRALEGALVRGREPDGSASPPPRLGPALRRTAPDRAQAAAGPVLGEQAALLRLG